MSGYIIYIYIYIYIARYLYNVCICVLPEIGLESETVYNRPTVFWDVVTVSVAETYRRFGETRPLHLRGNILLER